VTRYLSGKDILELATYDVCLAAAESAMAAESDGRTVLPPRIDTPSPTGFLRAMPAVLDDVMGIKVMTLVRGTGTRYLVLLYGCEDGALRGVFDADELTRLRTATYTAVAARLLVDVPPTELTVLGSGFEAEGHIRVLAQLWPLHRVVVYSRSADRRSAFASRLTAELGIEVEGYADRDAAIAAAGVVLLATKANEPVLDGRHLRQGAVVLSIGSTRPDLRELDRATMARTGTLLVDDVRSVMLESGDIIEGLREGDIAESRFAAVAQAARDQTLLQREPDRDLLTFKSVGTALQDLSLARAVLAAAEETERGRDLGELATLKPFADSAVAGGSR
jgi:ornithine cyclodeaminase/alanine dehydrogenase-like protein (mu-crystallin family)